MHTLKPACALTFQIELLPTHMTPHYCLTKQDLQVSIPGRHTRNGFCAPFCGYLDLAQQHLSTVLVVLVSIPSTDFQLNCQKQGEDIKSIFFEFARLSLFQALKLILRSQWWHYRVVASKRRLIV